MGCDTLVSVQRVVNLSIAAAETLPHVRLLPVVNLADRFQVSEIESSGERLVLKMKSCAYKSQRRHRPTPSSPVSFHLTSTEHTATAFFLFFFPFLFRSQDVFSCLFIVPVT